MDLIGPHQRRRTGVYTSPDLILTLLNLFYTLSSTIFVQFMAFPQLTELSAAVASALLVSDTVQAPNALMNSSAWNAGSLREPAMVEKRRPECAIEYWF